MFGETINSSLRWRISSYSRFLYARLFQHSLRVARFEDLRVLQKLVGTLKKKTALDV